MIRFLAALVVAGIGWLGVMATQKFHYKALSRKQLAQMVYELNHALVDAVHTPAFSQWETIREKAQKMINRARLEGLL